MSPRRPSTARHVVVAVAWIVLLLVHYFLVFAFAGWLGTADDFIPWSLTALALWTWTRRRFDLRPLTSPGWRRVALMCWFAAIALAAAGIDEGHLVPIPAAPAAIVYAVLPVPIVLAVCIALFVSARPDKTVAPAT